MSDGKRLLDKDGVQDAMGKLADSILAHPRGTDDLAMVGIRRRGVPIANRVTEVVKGRTDVPLLEGILDITLYRDDLTQVASQPVVSGTQMGFDVTGKRIVLFDDVIFTGRTVRAALNAICEFGRPKAIELAVLVDRGFRELPVHADHVAHTVETTLEEVVKVHLQEVDGEDFVEVIKLETPVGE